MSPQFEGSNPTQEPGFDHSATTRMDQALLEAAAHGVARLDACLMLCAITCQPAGTDARTWALTHASDPLSPQQQAQWREWLARRAAGEPLAYLLGHKEFYGLSLQVSPAVLVPRPDTETLVDWALDLLRARSTNSPNAPPAKVMDLGTGSGAIALAVKHALPQTQVHASDRSPETLIVAQANARALGLNLHWHHSHWWTEIVEHGFDLVLSNPPYIAEGDPHLQALEHEPIGALTAGPTGLQDLEALIATTGRYLRPSGWLLLEHGYDQAAVVAQRLEECGFTDVQSRADLSGTLRCTGGRNPQLGE